MSMPRGTNGLVENNLLVNSPNGRAIKVGPPDPSGDPISSLVIRHNTMLNNLGPSDVQVAFDSSNIVIEGNIMQRSASGRPAVTVFDLRGEGIVVINNLFWLTDGVADETEAISTISNISLDPRLTGLGTADVVPSNPAAAEISVTGPRGGADQ